MIYKNQIKFFSTKNIISFIALSMIREVSVNKEFIMHTVRYICDLNVFFFFSPFLFSLFRIYFIMNFTMSNYISIIRSFSNCPCRGWRIQEESICVLTDLYMYTLVHRSNFIYNNTIARSMCAIIFFARSFEYIPFSLALSFKLLSPSSSLFQSGQNLSSSACTSFSFPFWRFLSKYNFTCSRSLCPCKNTYVFQR